MSGGQVSSKYLQSFEKDMNSLRRVSEGLLVSISILISRICYSGACEMFQKLVITLKLCENQKLFFLHFAISKGINI